MSDPAVIDLKELIGLPYGEAEKRLRDMGLWDDEAKGPRRIQRYRVEVRATFAASKTVCVLAASEEAAKRLALKQVGPTDPDDYDFDFEWEGNEQSIFACSAKAVSA